jgi:hypothetical protein
MRNTSLVFRTLTSLAIPLLVGCAASDVADTPEEATYPEDVSQKSQPLDPTTPACVATQFIAALNEGGTHDKFRHCVATCKIGFWCGRDAALSTDVLKESIDWACQYAPQWIKDQLNSFSKCGGWGGDDMVANGVGLTCSLDAFTPCSDCCEQTYTRDAPPTQPTQPTQPPVRTGTVNVGSAGLRVRTCPKTTCDVVDKVYNGQKVTISCQKYGTEVTGPYGKTKIWDYIGTGYVSDAYVNTGGAGLFAPLCP